MYDRNQRGDNKKGVEWEESGDDSGFQATAGRERRGKKMDYYSNKT